MILLRSLRRWSVRDKIKAERSRRLNHVEAVLPLKSVGSLSKIRNVGIIAHIDAGKTTTTQKMLSSAGALAKAGRVDDGDTVMDFLPQERERGITIRSAAISFIWQQHQINLIDTPGHVDFEGEVARSVMVLDGVVTIFDCVNGVQTQSLKVWRMAQAKQLPVLSFVNKLDRLGASLQDCLQSMASKLNCTPLLLQVPYFHTKEDFSVVDLVSMRVFTYRGEDSKQYVEEQLSSSHPVHGRAVKAREELVSSLSEFNGAVADKYLAQQTISPQFLKSQLRQTLLKQPSKVTAVAIGSALKGRGIQHLLDSIVDYLPSPEQIKPLKCLKSGARRVPSKADKLLGYCFKVIFDQEKGQLHFLRLFAGFLKKGSSVYNNSKQMPQRYTKIYRVRADSFQEMTEATAGDIVALTGLQGVQAGTTLTLPEDKFQLEAINLAAPVCFASIEATSPKEAANLKKAVYQLAKEDTSLHVKQDQFSGQLQVGGRGQLHLQVLIERLRQQRKLGCKSGGIQISFRQRMVDQFRLQIELNRKIKGVPHHFKLELTIEDLEREEQIQLGATPVKQFVVQFPRSLDFDSQYTAFRERANATKAEAGTVSSGSSQFIKNPNKSVQISKIVDQNGEDPICSIASLPFQFLFALENNLIKATHAGTFDYPLLSTRVILTGGSWCPNRCTHQLMAMAGAALRSQLKKTSLRLYQPIMLFRLQGQINANSVDQLLKKRAVIHQRGLNFIQGKIPFSQTLGYSKVARSQGMQLQLKPCNYGPVNGISAKQLINRLQK